MHRAEMRVVAGRAVGKLGHLQRAEADRAGVLQALHGRRCRRGDEIAADFASRRSRPCRPRNTCPCAPAARRAARPWRSPFASAASAASAAFSASSASIAMKALRRGCHFAIRSRQDCVTSRDDRRFSAIAWQPPSATSRPVRCSCRTAFSGLDAQRQTSQARDRTATCRRSPQNLRTPARWNWRCVSATSRLTGTPAASAIALISFAVGLVMRYLLLLVLARGCGPNPGWPCSTPPDRPFYRALNKRCSACSRCTSASAHARYWQEGGRWSRR